MARKRTVVINNEEFKLASDENISEDTLIELSNGNDNADEAPVKEEK